MGILNQMLGDKAGIVPRAVGQIFGETAGKESLVTMSFLQIYNNTLQDLLVESSPPGGSDAGPQNLALREDPRRGFYVEGLNEFAVSSFDEAQALVNFGLENRAIAPTLMNITSSRSHTVLTVNVKMQESSTRKLRSKLLLVDLAGEADHFVLVICFAVPYCGPCPCPSIRPCANVRVRSSIHPCTHPSV